MSGLGKDRRICAFPHLLSSGICTPVSTDLRNGVQRVWADGKWWSEGNCFHEITPPITVADFHLGTNRLAQRVPLHFEVLNTRFSLLLEVDVSLAAIVLDLRARRVFEIQEDRFLELLGQGAELLSTFVTWTRWSLDRSLSRPGHEMATSRGGGCATDSEMGPSGGTHLLRGH